MTDINQWCPLTRRKKPSESFRARPSLHSFNSSRKVSKSWLIHSNHLSSSVRSCIDPSELFNITYLTRSWFHSRLCERLRRRERKRKRQWQTVKGLSVECFIINTCVLLLEISWSGSGEKAGETFSVASSLSIASRCEHTLVKFVKNPSRNTWLSSWTIPYIVVALRDCRLRFIVVWKKKKSFNYFFLRAHLGNLFRFICKQKPELMFLP